MISGGPVCILIHPDKLFIRGPLFWGLCPIAIDVISMETKPYLVEYWLQLKTETEHPDSNPEVHVYVHKACAKGIKTCARRNNIVGIICNWIFPDHPDLRETALFRAICDARHACCVFEIPMFSASKALETSNIRDWMFLSWNQRVLKLEPDQNWPF